MRYRLFLRAAVAVLVLLVVILVVGPAFAQTVPAPVDTGTNVLSAILAAVLAAIPGLALGGWALFKAYAAKSAAMWDDEAVAFVEKIAAGVVKASSPATAAVPASTAPITGVDH